MIAMAKAAERRKLDEWVRGCIASGDARTAGTLYGKACLEEVVLPARGAREIDRSLQRLRKAGLITFAKGVWSPRGGQHNDPGSTPVAQDRDRLADARVAPATDKLKPLPTEGRSWLRKQRAMGREQSAVAHLRKQGYRA